jgi:peptidoglycan/xylan/chitin deacetylase (PgdA/CDA1 family)
MRFKRLLKDAAVTAGKWRPGVDPAARRVVLCYHSVHPDRVVGASTPALFERHLAWLSEHCRLTSLAALVSGTTQHDGRPLAAITFDDGYEDNHRHALPLLARYGAPATFFLTAGFLECEMAVRQHLARAWPCPVEDLAAMEWRQVRELRAAGMAIGAHTWSHPNLARLGRDAADRELRAPRDLLADRLSADVDHFAYPFGKPRVHFSAATSALVEAAGYRLAAAVAFRDVRAADSIFAIPRFFTDGDSVDKLAAKVRGDYDMVGWWQTHAPLPVMRLISPDDFSR